MANRKKGTSKKSAPKDFERKQVRVGKLKPGAANRTDTSFTAKALRIKDQSIPEEQDILARRKDALARLAVNISQISHYSPSFRKEAVVSIGRILKDLPDVHMHILGVSESLVRTVVDDDHTVRQAGVIVWTWIFKSENLRNATGTVLNILVPFLKMGLTHLKNEVCADTAKILVCLVEECPRAIKPHMADLVVCLCRHFTGKSFESVKKNDVDLVELYNSCCKILTTNETVKTNTIEYTWEPVQTRSLRLPVRTVNLKTALITPSQLDTVMSLVIPSAIQVWSHVGYLLASPSFATSDHDEMIMYERCHNTIKSCWCLCKMCGKELSTFVPVKVAQSSSWLQLMSKFENK